MCLIINLGVASLLTQGSQLGWFEYGRPGHPKERKCIVELDQASVLTMGYGKIRWESNKTPYQNEI